MDDKERVHAQMKGDEVNGVNSTSGKKEGQVHVHRGRLR